MESRQMVLMNLSTGHKGDADREKTFGHREGKRRWGDLRE